ncbi:MAG TPA: alkene reductase [Burkholderiaceae bacterium]|nr:alkene reductase [Burkholderiaceae bacterium]
MTTLFDPCTAGEIKLANRIVMAPLTRNRAPQAIPTPLMARYYEQRASAGLLITEGTAITHQGQGYADVPGLWSDEQVMAWRAVTDAVHAKGGRIVTQLWHVGRVSHASLQPGGAAPVAPSAIVAKTKTVLIVDGMPRFVETSMPRELGAAEIPAIVQDYVRAARNAIRAGFDGVELHGANGYLVDQFLRAGSNHRTDEWGGSIDKRTRFLVEVLTAIVAAIGGGRTGVRLSPVTPANDAFDAEPQALFTRAVQRLAPLGLAYVHVIEGSTGAARDHQMGEQAFDYVALKAAYREAGGRGAWMVNNGYTLELASRALEQGADLVAFGRAFIANPDLPARLKAGGPFNAPDRATFYGGGAQGYVDYPAL